MCCALLRGSHTSCYKRKPIDKEVTGGLQACPMHTHAARHGAELGL